MGISTQDLIAQIFLKPSHYCQDNDQGHYPYCYPRNRDPGNEGNKSLFSSGLQVSKANIQFVRHNLNYGVSSFNCGKRITSLIEGESVKTITSLSIPIPSPAVGGIPYSKAQIKSLSIHKHSSYSYSRDWAWVINLSFWSRGSFNSV